MDALLLSVADPLPGDAVARIALPTGIAREDAVTIVVFVNVRLRGGQR